MQSVSQIKKNMNIESMTFADLRLAYRLFEFGIRYNLSQVSSKSYQIHLVNIIIEPWKTLLQLPSPVLPLNLKADSHIACGAHAVPLPCRAAKCLECVFPIWFTQCGRVWFTHAMPRPCHPRPCRSSQCHGTAWPSRDCMSANCPHSASSGYHAEFHEVVIKRIPISDADGQCETKHRLHGRGNEW